MGFIRESINDYFLLDTPVENLFINEYMKAAPGDYVKVYLFALMYAGLDEKLTNADVAKALGLEPEDVLKAWTYWEKQNLIRKHMKGSESGFDYDVEFLVLKQQLYGQPPAHQTAVQSISQLMEDPPVKQMIMDIEQITGRVFSSSELQKILSWIEEYQMLPETITYAFSYARKQRKTSLKYVQALVQDWGSRGLQEVASVEEELGKQDRRRTMQRRVFQALGFARNATEEEQRIIDSWFDELGMSLETVLDACSRTSGISSPNINYVNKVLQNWNKEGRREKTDTDAPTGREIMEYYDLLRQTEEMQAQQRAQEVYTNVPKIREIEERITALNSELSRIIISDTVDKKKAGAKIRQEMERLNMEKAFLLTENDYELDYMDTHYTCPLCKDTGLLETGERCQCYEKVTRDQINQLLNQVKR
ncbi:MAG: DnaD domain protein [Firmicutes bacterium]|nr:DnaD domain protein [Bacillota bacterium]